MAARWLIKTEPGGYGWADLVRDGGAEWDGVRNAAAAGRLRAMRAGDRVLVCHSGAEKAAVGVARVARGARPDGEDGRWVSVRVEPEAALPRPVTLTAMRADARLAALPALRQPRLSVAPVDGAQWDAILALAAAG